MRYFIVPKPSNIKILTQSEIIHLLNTKKDPEIINQYVRFKRSNDDPIYIVSKVTLINRFAQPISNQGLFDPELARVRLEPAYPSWAQLTIDQLSNGPAQPIEIEKCMQRERLSERTFCCC